MASSTALIAGSTGQTGADALTASSSGLAQSGCVPARICGNRRSGNDSIAR